MKKFALLLAASLLIGGTAFAKEENGALGFGFISDSSDTALIGGGVRGSAHLDVGYQLVGPIFYGFEFQGDIKKLNEQNFDVSGTDIEAYHLGGGWWAVNYNSYDYTQTYTMWDIDFSPRGYVSVDLGDGLQVLGYGGLNYNFQSLDYTVTNNDSSQIYVNDQWLDQGDSATTTKTFPGVWQVLAGFRGTVGAFYLDYTRFLNLNSNEVSWANYGKDRIGAGVNLRF